MNRSGKFVRPALVSCAVACAALLCGPGTALAADGIKAAYVEQVIPNKTFNDRCGKTTP